ncbi:hypothetical protein ABD86_14890 [Paenibacillus alvei]|nr:hypothetical protein [Paenibacillus alvei]MBG9745152.1 hypothetical protein [Paenibacillus alvei]
MFEYICIEEFSKQLISTRPKINVYLKSGLVLDEGRLDIKPVMQEKNDVIQAGWFTKLMEGYWKKD